MNTKLFGYNYKHPRGKDEVNQLKVNSVKKTQFQSKTQFAMSLINVGFIGRTQTENTPEVLT